MNTNPSHTKDFKEAAEKYYWHGEQDPVQGWPVKARIIEAFKLGMEAGYAEAMKEQREFYLKVSSYMVELELYLSKTGEADYTLLESLHTDVLKHLSSFTEQEQSKHNTNGE
jgi:hypothetical protein